MMTSSGKPYPRGGSVGSSRTHTRYACSWGCAGVASDADVTNAKKRRFTDTEKNETIYMLEKDSDCRNKECEGLKNHLKGLEEKISQLSSEFQQRFANFQQAYDQKLKQLDESNRLFARDRALLILRACSGDMERIACWMTLKRHKIEHTMYQFRTFDSLKTEYALEAKKLLLQWWDPEHSSKMNLGILDQKQQLDTLGDALKPFYSTRGDGNGVAHPPFLNFEDKRKLVQLAKRGRGENFTSAFAMFKAYGRMKRTMDQQQQKNLIEDYEQWKADLGETVDIGSLRLDEVIVKDEDLQLF